MKPSLAKYKIGLLVLGIFSLVLLGVVVVQAGAAKQDSTTFARATSISDKLNNYVLDKNSLPESLSAAGVSSVPPEISYQKLSSSSYKFCATYKTKSTNFSASSTESNLLSAAVGGGQSSGSSTTYDSSLILDGTHKKGQNCQTVHPTIVSNPIGVNSGTTNTADPYAKCDAIVDDTAWQKCIDDVSKSQTNQSSTFTN